MRSTPPHPTRQPPPHCAPPVGRPASAARAVAARAAACRRDVVAGLVGAVVAAVASPALADDSPSPSLPPAERFDAPEFSITVPGGFDFAPPPGAPSSSGPALTAEERGRRGRGAGAPENPVKARFVRAASGCGGGGGGAAGAAPPVLELTVVARSASAIKPTFTQLTDMAQWGSAADVAKLLLPRGARATAPPRALAVVRPPRDTGTPAGVVATPPLTLYAYEFEVGGARVALTAAARAGRVFVAAGAAPAGCWGEAGGELTEAVQSLRVTQLRIG